MNNLDKQYTDLLQDILDNGVEKKDRTGTGTLSVFGRQIRHKMSDGFPLLTSKHIKFDLIVSELIWFLQGRTDLRWLLEQGNTIWVGDAHKRFILATSEDEYQEPTEDARKRFIDKIKNDKEFSDRFGDLGPIYGFQWRNWGKDFKQVLNETGDKVYDITTTGIDQIANLIHDLKTNPDSRRLMVNAWNVGELDQMVLPPCHFSFQVYTRELSTKERWEWYSKNGGPYGEIKLIAMMVYENEEDNSHIKSWLEKWAPNVPTRAISLMWNQRSVDTGLGLPFNIASYGLLLEIIAKAVNMVPDELIGNLGDTHLYLNHIEQAKEQIGRELSLDERTYLYKKQQNLSDDVTFSGSDRDAHRVFDDYCITKRTREPYPLPTLKIVGYPEEYKHPNDERLFEEFDISNFQLENYQSHPAIKLPLSN